MYSISNNIMVVIILTNSNDSKRRFITYTSTWDSNIDDFSLENIPSYITDINLSFVLPDTRYEKDSFDFSQQSTGLEFVEGATKDSVHNKFTNEDVANLKNRIKQLQDRGTNVWISIGGWLYSQSNAWESFSAKHVVDLAVDLGVSGVDIDWEPTNSTCNKETADTFACTKDSEIIGIITTLYDEIHSRNLSLGISIAAWSTGAYYVKDTPFEEGKVITGSPYGGTLYRLVKDHGEKLSFINIMTYDGGKTYDPREGYASYRAIFDGVINLGFEIGPEGAGDAILNLRADEHIKCDDSMLDGKVVDISDYYNVETLVNYIKKHGKETDGFFLWELWKHRRRKPLDGGAATVATLSQYLCENVPLDGDCSETVPTLPNRNES